MIDPTADEMRDHLDKFGRDNGIIDPREGPIEWEFSRECAIYWYAADYHDGQTSSLYSALSTSEYRPSPMENGPEPGSNDELLYQELERAFSGAGEEAGREELEAGAGDEASSFIRWQTAMTKAGRKELEAS